ncbi:MAG TPA: hypothetical protein VES01_00020 [Dermatophilaceae bacterium]|nr:hypothetical protein [Dermatophilaceae bacterium]
MTIMSSVSGVTGSSGMSGLSAASGQGRAPSRGAPRLLRLAGVAEDTHHWYEESDIGRHLPQIIDLADQGPSARSITRSESRDIAAQGPQGRRVIG